MKRLSAIIGSALLILALPLAALGHHGTLTNQGNCPVEGKVESVVEGDIDGIVLEAGTHVCIKGGQTTVLVTADGEATLFELLGADKNVSHYTVIQTTTTTVPEETTTTVEVTTTTVAETTTTQPEQETTTTTLPFDSVGDTTTVPEVTTTTVAPVPAGPDIEELPFTGLDPAALAGVASLLAVGGAGLVRKSRS